MQQRIDIVKQMQQIVYDESPYIPLVYPEYLEAADTTTWTGWVRAQDNKGGWWYNTQPDTYVAAHPGTAAVKSSSSNATLIIALVAAVVIVIAIILLLMRRRGARTEVEG